MRAAAFCLAAAALASQAQPAAEKGGPSDKAAREAAAKARAEQIRAAAEADYKAARARCDTKHGNDKDVCIKVAKAFLADARASASAKPTAAR